MNIGGLKIDFPVIEGDSQRQIDFAERLREEYVSDNRDRFVEIEDMVSDWVDRKMTDDFDEDEQNSIYAELSEKERCCLFFSFAGGIIGRLKK